MMSYKDVVSGETMKEYATQGVVETLAKHDLDLENFGVRGDSAELIIELMRLAFAQGHLQGMADLREMALASANELKKDDKKVAEG